MKLEKRQIISIVLGVILIAVIVLIIIKSCDKKAPNNDAKGPDEESITKEYNLSKEDAIEIVKIRYISDNYEYTASANNNNQYIVVVTNILNGKIDKYIVDPNTREATILTEE